MKLKALVVLITTLIVASAYAGHRVSQANLLRELGFSQVAEEQGNFFVNPSFLVKLDKNGNVEDIFSASLAWPDFF